MAQTMAAIGEILAAMAPTRAYALLAVAALSSFLLGPVLHAAVSTIVWTARLSVLAVAVIYFFQLQGEPRLRDTLDLVASHLQTLLPKQTPA